MEYTFNNNCTYSIIPKIGGVFVYTLKKLALFNNSVLANGEISFMTLCLIDHIHIIEIL